VHVFDQMQADPDRRLDAVDVMLANEPERLVAWGRGPLAQSGVASALVGPTIGARATSQPTAPSYVDARGRDWSYADLMQRRDATARRLAALLGPAPAVVAVASRRTIDYVALQLAAYSHGWMLVPLDPEWPAHRMRAVMDVAAPALVLYDDPDVGRRLRQIVDERRALEPDPRTQAAAAAPGSVVALAATAVAPLVEDGESVRTAVIVPPPVSAAEASWPVYSIFTSGSTGAPKGVLIAQRALAAHGHGAVHAYGLGAADRVLQFAAPAFDVAVEETIPTLMAGGALIELPEGLMADLRAFLAFVHQRRLTVLNLPSAFFHLLMLHLDEQRATLPACVRLVVIGSEKPTSWSVSTFVERHPGVRLMNAYGPTEATITSLVCDVSGLALAGGLQGDPPIGRPLGACEVMLLDQRSSPCPVGIAGEICIAGPQVAMGYINAPEQAASRLTRSPRDGAPMYRTGDLGRWRADGLIEFLGRADEQVKIRGVRVEPGEIEAAIRAIDGVNDAAVVVRSAGRGNELVAFVVKRVDFMATEAALRAHLQERLPGAFVPSEIRYIAELPLNTSGKVHRKALAEEARRLVPSSREITGPTGDLETYIHGVFTRLLERGDIDIDDSFFDIGGHSLLAVRLVGELNGIAKTPVALATVFGSPSVRALASSIGTLRTAVQLPSVIALNARATTYLRADEAARALEPEPMFFICGVHLYTRVAQAMEPDRAAFGIFLDFDAEVVAGKRLRLHVPTMAAEYLAKLRDVCPRGPYLLAGVSFGGMLAYEMAQQLRAAGDDVRLLVLLDTILPRAFVARGRREVMMRWVRRYFVRSLGMDPKVALREALGRWFGRAPHRAASEEGLKVLRDRVFRAAAEEHDTRVAPYDGAVVLIRARQRLDLDDERITWDLGWSGLLPHGTAFFAVDGDHLGILVEPGNLEVARIVRQQVALLDDQRRRMPVPPRFK
jgi:amino acid adenylation domain-containing protein